MPDPEALRARLAAAGARRGFAGMMTDVRFDRNGELVSRGEVLRIRRFRSADEAERVLLAWKGPTGISEAGHKARRELEFEIRCDRADPGVLLEALGYSPAHCIERYVEYYHLANAEIRLEWYPRMDTLVEVEGDEAGIEAAIQATGLPQPSFGPEPLAVFAERFAARTGSAPALTLAELGDTPPSWTGR